MPYEASKWSERKRGEVRRALKGGKRTRGDQEQNPHSVQLMRKRNAYIVVILAVLKKGKTRKKKGKGIERDV